MPRLIWVFAGCTCDFVGVVMLELIRIFFALGLIWVFRPRAWYGFWLILAWYNLCAMRAVKKLRRLSLSNAFWYTHCLTIYISVIRFLHSTYLRIFRLNDVTYLSTHAVYITMVTRNGRSCNLSGSSLKMGVYTSKKWKDVLLNRYYCWTTILE